MTDNKGRVFYQADSITTSTLSSSGLEFPIISAESRPKPLEPSRRSMQYDPSTHPTVIVLSDSSGVTRVLGPFRGLARAIKYMHRHPKLHSMFTSIRIAPMTSTSVDDPEDYLV